MTDNVIIVTSARLYIKDRGSFLKLVMFIIQILLLVLFTACGVQKGGDAGTASNTAPPSVGGGGSGVTTITFATITAPDGDEGTTQYTADFSCSSSAGGTPSYTTSYANCSIDTSGNARLKCDIPYNAGQSDWTFDNTVTCTIGGNSSSQQMTVNVTNVNVPPALDSVTNRSAYIATAMTTVDLADGADDKDSDNDTLTYSCTFTGGAFSTSTNCTSLPGTPAFNTSTGVLDWTPNSAAAVGGNDTVYTITATANDGNSGTDSVNFTITVVTVSAPTYVSTNISSPNNSTNQPLIKGTSTANTVTVSLYSNDTCTTQIGTDTKAVWEGDGVQATVTANTTATIYAKAYDASSNESVCTYMTSFTHDDQSPAVTLSSSTADPHNSSTYTVNLTFDEAVTGVETGDFTITNGTPSNITGSGTAWTVDISPNSDGNVNVTFDASGAQDAAGNGNTVSNTLTHEYDSTPPVDNSSNPSFSPTTSDDGDTTVSWTAFSDPNLSDYRVYSYTDSGCTANEVNHGLVGGTTASMSLTGLSSNNTHYVKIVAYDSLGNSTTGSCSTSSHTVSPPALLQWNLSSFDYGYNTVIRDQVFTLSNAGSGTSSTISTSLTVNTGNNNKWSIVVDNCNGQTLSGSSNCTVTVRYDGSRMPTQTSTATLDVTATTGGSDSISLSGRNDNP